MRQVMRQSDHLAVNLGHQAIEIAPVTGHHHFRRAVWERSRHRLTVSGIEAL
jgi:hypothetical protein